MNRRIELRKPKNPGPGTWKLPILRFMLNMKINIEKAIKKRLVIWLILFIMPQLWT